MGQIKFKMFYTELVEAYLRAVVRNWKSISQQNGGSSLQTGLRIYQRKTEISFSLYLARSITTVQMV